MADLSPNFVNPSYATPEQIAQQRAYADALMKRSGQDVTRPTGAIGNMLDAVTSILTRNNANDLQINAAQNNSRDVSALIAQLQHGHVDPGTLGTISANPMASPEIRGMANVLMQPKPIEDVAGRPGFISPSAGVQTAPISGAFTPGYRAPVAAGNASTVAPFPASNNSQPSPLTPTNPQGGAFGGLNYRPLDMTPQPGSGGGQADGGALPAPSPPASPLMPAFQTLDQLGAKGRELDAEAERTHAGAKGEGEVILKDVSRAASAPEVLKGLGIMRNTIQTVGDNMTFGPTAKFSNEARRVIQNYAPGLVDEKSLAGADAVEKLNLGLAGNLSQQLGLNPSDIYRSVASVPGNEKSKAGTLALISMMEQQARNDQYVGTTLYQQNRGNLAAYQQARADYYAHHPIINPITGNPIEIDAKHAQAPAAQYEKTATNPKTGEKIGLRNGQWVPIK